MNATIRVRINGEEREVSRGISVFSLLQSLDINPKSVVVEKNLTIVKQERFEEEQVAEGDMFEIVNFVGGGM